uniref:DUF7027 domain-containing protein n=1 Tax=Ditylenchus dipsaci TaxID=166011 RepID=A0A915EV27_9BILA
MDFNPEHEKWQCCCCRISSGLKMLGGVEVLISLAIAAVGVANGLKTLDAQNEELPFYLSLSVVAFLVASTSLLLVIGIQTNREKLMYPTLVARAIVIIFVTVFGVSSIVQPSVIQHDDQNSVPKPETKTIGRNKQQEPSTALRLVFLMLLMIFLSIGIFYTIYLVVRSIRYVISSKRLADRRQSLIMAGQIDPLITASYGSGYERKGSRGSLSKL